VRPPSGPSTPPEDALVQARHDRLLELADERATGALYLDGRWGGTVFLVRGQIGYVESVLTPGVEALLLRPGCTDERAWADLIAALRQGENSTAVNDSLRVLRDRTTSAVRSEILRRSALADAAFAALGTVGPEPARARARFRPGETHWYEPGRTFDVADVLAEVTRRKAVLARMTLGVRMDRPLQRAAELPLDRIRLTATSWNIIRLADGSNTPLDVAWLLGHGAFATTVAAHQLGRLGLLVADSDLSEAISPPTLPARHVLSFVRASQLQST
jgi:hypothetical protein